jgi:chlorite dismutase
VIERSDVTPPAAPDWMLRGVTSNARHTHRQEIDAMAAVQQALHRPEATRAALIPIRKTEAWWALAQNERRALFEGQSRHIDIGLEYQPAIARRPHHSRELGEAFDFLTRFEYAPEHSDAFEMLVLRLRETAELRFVDREVDIRLSLPELST